MDTLTTRTASTTDSPAPLLVTVASVGLLAVGLLLASTAPAQTAEGLTAEDVVDGVMLMAYPLVGALLLRRGAPATLGRLFLAIGLVTGLGFLAGGYADHPDLPGSSVASLVGDAGFVVMISLATIFVLLHFPDGRLPSPRWRVVLRVAQVMLVTTVLTILLAPGPVDEDAPHGPTNPLGVGGAGDVIDLVGLVCLVLFGALSLLAVGSLLWRLRHAAPGERRKIGILGAAAAVLVGLFLLDSTLQAVFGDVYGIAAAVVAIAAVPAATAYALLGRTSE